jgi:hypothetical protein
MDGPVQEAGPPEDLEVEFEMPSEKNADLIMGVCSNKHFGCLHVYTD